MLLLVVIHDCCWLLRWCCCAVADRALIHPLLLMRKSKVEHFYVYPDPPSPHFTIKHQSCKLTVITLCPSHSYKAETHRECPCLLVKACDLKGSLSVSMTAEMEKNESLWGQQHLNTKTTATRVLGAIWQLSLAFCFKQTPTLWYCWTVLTH